MTSDNQRDPIGTPARLLLREVVSRGDIPLVDELVTGDYVQYDPARSDPIRGPDALKEAVRGYRRGMPDLTKTIEAAIVDDPAVAIHYTATGTHDGTLVGVEPTGRGIEVEGVYVARVEDGKLTRGSDMWDVFGLLRQVGALPEQLDD